MLRVVASSAIETAVPVVSDKHGKLGGGSCEGSVTETVTERIFGKNSA